MAEGVARREACRAVVWRLPANASSRLTLELLPGNFGVCYGEYRARVSLSHCP
jgi:hypothetical protein